VKNVGKSYAWARHAHISPNRGRLTERAAAGLEYAELLAEDALTRSQNALRNDPFDIRMPPLTLDELAARDRITLATAERRIRQARHELFGTLSDSGIYYRLRRKKTQAQRATLICAAPSCWQKLPRTATPRRKYCGTRCRVSDHRARRRAAEL
jgi:hypothetical protein